MKHINKIKYLIFAIWMMVNVNIYAQGDALSIEQKCDPSKLDLTIDGGFAPYEVEWQALVNGT